MKTLRLLIPILLLATASLSARTRAEHDFPKVTFGLEGNFLMTAVNAYHYNFVAVEGDRIDVKAAEPGFFANGQVLMNVGVNVSQNWNISLESGWCGVYRKERIVPLMMKLTWLKGSDPLADRWLTFFSAGPGWNNLENPRRISAMARIGGGRRISLNRSVKLDFLSALHWTYTHPIVYQEGRTSAVTGPDLRRNDAYIIGVTLGIGLTF